MGPCTELEKEDYTLVLRGMIALSMAVFPRGTAGCQIDAIARMPLWKARRNFGHGTGHGVGYYLCVHEGPQSIRYQYNSHPLLPGMVTSNEPGFYLEGAFGVRLENLTAVKEVTTNSYGRFLRFETLTMVPFDLDAIIPELLAEESRGILNAYHAKVRQTLAPYMTDEENAWLAEATRAI